MGVLQISDVIVNLQDSSGGASRSWSSSRVQVAAPRREVALAESASRSASARACTWAEPAAMDAAGPAGPAAVGVHLRPGRGGLLGQAQKLLDGGRVQVQVFLAAVGAGLGRHVLGNEGERAAFQRDGRRPGPGLAVSLGLRMVTALSAPSLTWPKKPWPPRPDELVVPRSAAHGCVHIHSYPVRLVPSSLRWWGSCQSLPADGRPVRQERPRILTAGAHGAMRRAPSRRARRRQARA